VESKDPMMIAQR